MKPGVFLLLAGPFIACAAGAKVTYPIVDTGQVHTYDDQRAIEYPKTGKPYFGQDAQYAGRASSYKDHGDGTVSDRVTGLMWTRNPGGKKTFAQAVKGAGACKVGGHSGWRLPTIKELYSLIRFNGLDPDPRSSEAGSLTPFIDDEIFAFRYGDPRAGERIIDSQFATSTKYVSTTMRGNETMFGVNFADGRIKGYPIKSPRGEKTYYVLYVRGNPEYGRNRFEDNKDGTITDEATGLTWMKADSGKGMDWPSALAYAENLDFAGHGDWRLPNAKELQSIVDYTRSPDTTGSAAIDPVFEATEIRNEGGKKDFGCYWTSSSHLRENGSRAAVYLAFGRGLGFMQDRRTGEYRLLDVHGAGAQRSDPKVGDASRYPHGRGPQGDVIRIDNLVRCVRGGNVTVVETGPGIETPPPTPRHGRPDRPPPADRNGPPPEARDDWFLGRNDPNRDGKVSKDEFRGPPEHFGHLDRNGDGVISADEAPKGPPPRRR